MEALLLTLAKSLCYFYYHCYFAGVFTDGRGAYLFHEVVEQQYKFHVVEYALCLSESKQNHVRST